MTTGTQACSYEDNVEALAEGLQALEATLAGLSEEEWARPTLLNTDSPHYGGSDVGNFGGVETEPIPWHEQPFSAEMTLPPLAALWLVPDEG